MHVCLRIYACTHTYINIYIHTNVCMYACACVCVNEFVYMFVEREREKHRYRVAKNITMNNIMNRIIQTYINVQYVVSPAYRAYDWV